MKRAVGLQPQEHILAGLEIELLVGRAGQVRDGLVHQDRGTTSRAGRGKLVPGTRDRPRAPPRSGRRESGVVQSRTRPVLGPLNVRSIRAGAPSAKLKSVRVPSTGVA